MIDLRDHDSSNGYVGRPTNYPYRAQAIDSYKGNLGDPNKISFSKNEMLKVYDVNGRRWQVRKETGEEDIAPSNRLIQESSASPLSPPQIPNTGAPTMAGLRDHHDPRNKVGWSTEYPYRPKAMYAYEANPDDPNEISFSKHELFEVSDASRPW